jgi:hypothetical protein
MASTPCLLYTILCVVFEARVINLFDRDIATTIFFENDEDTLQSLPLNLRDQTLMHM